MLRRWIAALAGVTFGLAAAVPAAAAPASASAAGSGRATFAEERYVLDDGGFEQTVGVLAANARLQDGMELQFYAGNRRLAASEVAATGQTLRVAAKGDTPAMQMPVIVMGDVLGIGKASIGQLTRLSAALTGAQPLDGVWLAAGDLDGSGTIDLSDLVQASEQLLAVMNTQSGTLTQRMVQLCITSPDERTEIPLWFADAAQDIPYISTATMDALLSSLLTTGDQADDPVRSENGQGSTIVFERTDRPASRATFNFEDRTVHFTGFNGFFRGPSAATSLDLLGEQRLTDHGTSRYIERAAGSFERAGRPVDVDFAKYDIPLVWRGSTGYIPLQTFSDLFLSPMCTAAVYNGAMVGIIPSYTLGSLAGSYYAARPQERSAELAAFSYNELCLALDMYYGLREQHSIENFDQLFRQTGLNEPLTSMNAVEADKTLRALAEAYLGDLHTQLVSASHYAGRNADTQTDLATPSFDDYMQNSRRMREVRQRVYPNGIPSYEEIGATAFITIDQLSLNNNANYYLAPPAANVQDTAGIIGYAHARITRENSPVRNVVVDLSCCAGGELDAAVYLLGWLLGTATIDINDTLTGAQASTRYRSDVNFDGVYDSNDTVQNLNRCCIVSPATFSGANLAASVLKGNGITLIGQQTSGGTCVVMPLTCADGTVLNISGPHRISVLENGSYYDVDRGVVPQYRLALFSDFFDRQNLCSMLEDIGFASGAEEDRT